MAFNPDARVSSSQDDILEGAHVSTSSKSTYDYAMDERLM